MTTDKHQISPIADDLSKLQIAISLNCSRCGYDIRGLLADGDCPECGEPVRLTIIDVVDPASRRLPPIHKPVVVGNSIMAIVLFCFIAYLFTVIVIWMRSQEYLPIPTLFHAIGSVYFLWGSACCGLIAFFNLTPMLQMCRRKELEGCRTGIILTGAGLLTWVASMVLIVLVLPDHHSQDIPLTMLLDTVFPILAGGLVFSGFRRLIPRLGQRSRAFRYAQGSRQRMNDLLATLFVVVLGRTLVGVASNDSNLLFLGTIILVMSILLILIGLGYLLRNTLWIRQALVTPPPALSEILRSNH